VLARGFALLECPSCGEHKLAGARIEERRDVGNAVALERQNVDSDRFVRVGALKSVRRQRRPSIGLGHDEAELTPGFRRRAGVQRRA
jgi:hypothetical protein